MKSLRLSVPYVIAMIGQPGTGKTFFAEAFADNFKVPIVDEEYFRSRAKDPDDGTQIAADVLQQIMKTRQVVLFEGRLDLKEERESLVRFSSKHDYEVLFVWAQTEPETARKRALKTMSKEEYTARIDHFVPPTDKENYVVISGKHTQATQARTVLKHLVQSRSRQNTPVSVAPRPAKTARRKAI